MNKSFFQVLPDLKVEPEIQTLFEGATIQKVSTDSKRTHLKFYMDCEHIISKAKIRQMENQIKLQLFPRARIQVEIVEHFVLPPVYTPENILHEYLESLLFELKEESVVAYNMLSAAKYTVEEGNILCLKLDDSIVAEGHKDVIADYLTRVFLQRFDRPVEVRILYRETKRSALTYNNLKIQQEVEEIRKAAEESRIKEQKEKELKAAAGKSQDNTRRGEAKVYVRSKAEPLDETNLVYGRAFNDEPIELSTVVGEMGEITFRGQVISFDTREIRGERTIVMYGVTDFTDTIMVKMFVRNDQLADVLAEVKPGAFLKIKGVTNIDRFDGELTIGNVFGIQKISDFRESRVDTAPEKRVELHCHTKMSDMDGVSDAADIIKRAHAWGHKAIAITDHGAVQAFPEAYHALEAIGWDDPFKVIFGVEGYLVDDLQDIAVNEKRQSLDDTYVVFDLETTGFSPIKDKIIEIGAVKVEAGKITDSFMTFVNPRIPIPFKITQLTSITDRDVADAPDIETILPKFLEFIGDAPLVAHNASFDVSFIEQNCRYQDISFDFTSVDTVALARVLLPTCSKYTLNVVAKALNINQEHHHRAVDDARVTAEIFVKFIGMLKDQNIYTLDRLNRFGASNVNAIRKMPSYHVIILARNHVGRTNLYTLISKSHLDYFGRQPRIPKSLLSQYREGLLVGSACEAGELFQAILNEKSEERIARIVSFYDYLEVQPLGNNRFMIESDKHSRVQTEEDLRDLNRKVVSLGEKFNKPVVATCDVHFLDPKDEVYRRIIMAGKGFSDADNQAPLYLHTTDEMLNEFEYLGSKKAYEIVVKNPNLIADMVDKIAPVRPDKCPPVIEDSDVQLRKICYDKAHSMYGENLPEIVVERLERELNSIISNGYAVMYIIAQKLVWKSNEDGYLVGSRGSVGSSFVATMAGITEVNPLSPHYYCKKCHYSEFESDIIKETIDNGGCGWDLPDKVCPVCGEPLTKDGFNIPFETFLGFKGNKEPDIDLNFSGDYQSNAHKYTEVIFGDGQTFRAGTIGTLADKTAFGFVKNYYEERGQRKRNCEIDRIVQGCTGIRRSTGQHPGGIIVLPIGENIHSFTPVQHPANDMTTDTVTTHFDYHSIDSNLLKLDILGHDDPTMIKALESYINSPAMDNEYDEENHPFVATEIKLDDPGVMSLFHDTSALGVTPEQLGGCELGCLGIPEFGTDFSMQMVKETKPKSISDLIRISGLSHGTDVWLTNAQELIKNGQATIQTAICTRDDIMVYLINKGLDSELSFNIMEKVRKGQVAKGKVKQWEDWKKEMLSHGVPEWYIWSCGKIKYMFPKAHAAAYVMMAYRIAYCKINYPLAYYAAFFSNRAKAFSYEMMCQGPQVLHNYLEEYKKIPKPTQKEQDSIRDMRIVEEMYARGFEFLPMDIYRSKAKEFQIVDGKLLPPFTSIEGMGENAAEGVEAGAKGGKYLSRDDFRERTKASKTVVETMARLGILEGLPESNQLSLFDL